MTHSASTLTGALTRGLRLRLPIGQWIRVARERQQLARLSERELADMGIDASAAAREAARPFWDLPRSR